MEENERAQKLRAYRHENICLLNVSDFSVSSGKLGPELNTSSQEQKRNLDGNIHGRNALQVSIEVSTQTIILVVIYPCSIFDCFEDRLSISLFLNTTQANILSGIRVQYRIIITLLPALTREKDGQDTTLVC